MQQQPSNPTISVQQEVIPDQPAVQGKPVPQEATPSSASPQVVQAIMPTLQYTLPHALAGTVLVNGQPTYCK